MENSVVPGKTAWYQGQQRGTRFEISKNDKKIRIYLNFIKILLWFTITLTVWSLSDCFRNVHHTQPVMTCPRATEWRSLDLTKLQASESVTVKAGSCWTWSET